MSTASVGGALQLCGAYKSLHRPFFGACARCSQVATNPTVTLSWGLASADPTALVVGMTSSAATGYISAGFSSPTNGHMCTSPPGDAVFGWSSGSGSNVTANSLVCTASVSGGPPAGRGHCLGSVALCSTFFVVLLLAALLMAVASVAAVRSCWCLLLLVLHSPCSFCGCSCFTCGCLLLSLAVGVPHSPADPGGPQGELLLAGQPGFPPGGHSGAAVHAQVEHREPERPAGA